MVRLRRMSRCRWLSEPMWIQAVVPRAFRTVSGAVALPGRGGQAAGDGVRADGRAAVVDPHPHRAGDGHHVAGAACFQGGAELGVLAVGFVAGHPGGGDAGVQRSGDHLRGETGLGGEVHRLGYPGRGAAFGIIGPGVLGQVEPTVDQGPSPLGGQGEEHADLGVLDASRGPYFNKCSTEGCWWESEI